MGYITVGKPTAIVLCKLFEVNNGKPPRIGYETVLFTNEKFRIIMAECCNKYLIRFQFLYMLPVRPDKRTNAQILEELVNEKLTAWAEKQLKG